MRKLRVQEEVGHRILIVHMYKCMFSHLCVCVCEYM